MIKVLMIRYLTTSFVSLISSSLTTFALWGDALCKIGGEQSISSWRTSGGSLLIYFL